MCQAVLFLLTQIQIHNRLKDEIKFMYSARGDRIGSQKRRKSKKKTPSVGRLPVKKYGLATAESRLLQM